MKLRYNARFATIALLLCLALLPIGATALSPIKPPVQPPKNLVVPKPPVNPIHLPTATPEPTERPINLKPGGLILNPEYLGPQWKVDLDKIINRPRKTGQEFDAEVYTDNKGATPVYDNYFLIGSMIGRLGDGTKIRVAVYTRGVAEIIGGSAGYIGGFVALGDLYDLANEPGDDYDPGCEFPEPVGDLYMGIIIGVPGEKDGLVDGWMDWDIDGKPWYDLHVGDDVVAQDYTNGSVEIWHLNGTHCFVAKANIQMVGPYE